MYCYFWTSYCLLNVGTGTLENTMNLEKKFDDLLWRHQWRHQHENTFISLILTQGFQTCNQIWAIVKTNENRNLKFGFLNFDNRRAFTPEVVLAIDSATEWPWVSPTIWAFDRLCSLNSNGVIAILIFDRFCDVMTSSMTSSTPKTIGLCVGPRYICGPNLVMISQSVFELSRRGQTNKQTDKPLNEHTCQIFDFGK